MSLWMKSEFAEEFTGDSEAKHEAFFWKVCLPYQLFYQEAGCHCNLYNVSSGGNSVGGHHVGVELHRHFVCNHIGLSCLWKTDSIWNMQHPNWTTVGSTNAMWICILLHWSFLMATQYACNVWTGPTWTKLKTILFFSVLNYLDCSSVFDNVVSQFIKSQFINIPQNFDWSCCR